MGMIFFTKEVKIALTAVLGIVVLFFGMNFLKGKNIFSTDHIYYARFANINGLTSSTPVFANGFQVGTVKDIRFDYTGRGDVMVKFGTDKQMVLPQGTTAEIESDMMGNVKMNLVLAAVTGESLQPGDTISGAVNGGMMGKVAEMVPSVEKMLPKLDSIMMSLNALLADPALAQSLHNVQDITSNLAVSTARLNVLMGSLNRNVPVMMAKANGVLDNTERLTGNLATVDVAATMEKINQTLANVSDLTGKLNSNDGTLGLLLNDKQLYCNLNKTMVSADSLLVNLRQHPKRYVHFSLFGRKDK